MKFVSDNEAPIMPEIMQAIETANRGDAPSYGEDELTGHLSRQFSIIFEKEVTVFPVMTGTAANSISLSQITPPYGAVLCHQAAHINVDECGAPEFFTGGKLIGLPGHAGKIAQDTLEQFLETIHPHDYHNSKVAALSLTQATESGTVYRPEELSALASIAREHGMLTHVDGARFANALVHLGCSPAELSWKSGVDIMSFGSSKNGTMNAEAIVSFNPDCSEEIRRHCKRAGQMASKMRFVACQLLAYLEDNRWLIWAGKCNELAQQLAGALSHVAAIDVVYPVEANMLMVRMQDDMADHLRKGGANFCEWNLGKDCYRLVLSNLNNESDIDSFRELARAWTPEC